MNDNTINNDMTMGGAGGMLLAGRYRVVRQLGQGGMGSVWLAEDTKLDGFRVAIKMLPSVLVNNKRAYAQVKAEALVSLKLSHPNIATVRAFEEESGSPFLVMDYIDGQTLDDYLAERGKLTEDETVKLLKPVAAALDYAHTQGVVHRDVKPGNVMIRKDGTPFVLDFGIAREIQETMTRVTGKLSSGTLLYMSPEQLNGDAPKPAQDIYSFAAMAYECMKGEPPFSRGQVEFQILNKDPEPLPGGSDLVRSILRGLAKAPVARPENCMGVVAPVVVFRPRPKPTFERVSVPKEDVRFIPPGDRAKFADSESIASSPAACPKDSSRFAPLPHEPRISNRGRFGVWTALLVLVIAGCAIWFAKSVNTEISSPEPNPPQAEEDAVNVRTEALSQIAVCRKIDKADGFGKKIEECENAIARGRSAFDVEDWSGAVKSYTEALRQCALVIEMSKDRDLARESAKAMEKQARAAKEAEADKYAKERFGVAKELVERARREFGEMNFGAAANSHCIAGEQFKKAIVEAKDSKERQTQVEVGRQRQAEEMECQQQAEMTRRAKWRQEGQSFAVGSQGVNIKMVWCPPGSFTAGDVPGTDLGKFNGVRVSERRITHDKGFWIGETEVTQGQWKRLTGETIKDLVAKGLQSDVLFLRNVKTGEKAPLRDLWGVSKDHDPSDRIGDIDDEIPLYYVSWTEACEFCRKLTETERKAGLLPDGYEYRLPSEAEWEYACRAGSTAALPNGRDLDVKGDRNIPALDAIAWYSGNASVGFSGRGWNMKDCKERQYEGDFAAPRKVKGKAPNAWGLYDILGNVEEWTSDCWKAVPDSGHSPIVVSDSGTRLIRGGGWNSLTIHCRPAGRHAMHPLMRSNGVGFRIALAPRYDGYPYVADIALAQSEVSVVGMADADGARAPVVKSKTVLLPNDVPIEMVWCGPSVFEVSPGVSQERKGFWIAKYELTQRQWKSVMRDNPSEFQNDTLPVENLSWNDCERFLSVLRARSSYKFRLPLGSEWEYAARGGPKGEVLMPPDDFAWWGRNSGDRTHEGGGKKPNALGLYDVLGNVWEWCAGTGAGENFGKRELRGGSFCNNNQKLIDAKTPMYSDQDVAGRGAGLRLVCDDL